MSALPCPIPDPFAAPDQAYAIIPRFLGSTEAHGTVETIFGTVTMSRTGYRGAGTASLHPLRAAPITNRAVATAHQPWEAPNL